MGLADFGKTQGTTKRKDTPPSFNNVAKVNPEPEVVEETKTEVSTEVNTDTSTEPSTNPSTTFDTMDLIRKGLTEVPKPIKKKQHSIYLKKDVAEELDKFLKKNPHTNKSEVINTLLERFLNIQR